MGSLLHLRLNFVVDPKSMVSQALGIPPNRSPIQSVQLPTVHSQTSAAVELDLLINGIQRHLGINGKVATLSGHWYGSVAWCSKKHLQRNKMRRKTQKKHKYHHQHKQYAYVYIRTAFSRFLHTLLIPDSLETMQPLLASCIGL